MDTKLSVTSLLCVFFIHHHYTPPLLIIRVTRNFRTDAYSIDHLGLLASSWHEHL